MSYGPPAHPGHVVINSHSKLSLGAEMLSAASNAGSSATWPAANRAILMPLYLPMRMTATKMFVVNGAAVSGNIDLGIYDATFARLVSSGSTAQSGTSAFQIVDITDTTLDPGTYYMALAIDNTTATTLRAAASNLIMRASGMAEMASAFVLPATITPAIVTNSYMPFVGVSFRTVTGSP